MVGFFKLCTIEIENVIFVDYHETYSLHTLSLYGNGLFNLNLLIRRINFRISILTKKENGNYKFFFSIVKSFEIKKIRNV